MSNSAAGQWVKFFNASGIPSPAAATYAHIFVENRIQIDMLMDLNKEYLREMGITPMGDIIAILRHAKHVSDQTAREKVLSTEAHVPVAAIPANPVLPIERTKIRLKSVTASSTSAAVVAPLPPIKPRRVLPEHEGKYKIKLPSGTTERSKQILAKQAKLYSDREAVKPSVFDRLTRISQKTGDEKESSWNKAYASPEVTNSLNKYDQDDENWDENDDFLRRTTIFQEIINIDDEKSLNENPEMFQRLTTISKEIIDVDKEPRRNRKHSKKIDESGVEIIDIDAKEATRKRNTRKESNMGIDIDNEVQTQKKNWDIYNRLNKTIDIDVESEDSTTSLTSVIYKGLVYSDREAAREKKDIFKRLAINSGDAIELDEESSQSSANSNQVRVKITGIGSKAQTSSSIFSRLGGKSDDVLTVTKQIKPILKNTAKNRLSTIVKAKAVAAPIVKPIKQKVLLVKKVPLKKDSDDDDDDDRIDQLTDDEMYDDIDTSGGSEKFVKFASTAEVREIAPRRHSSPTKKSFIARQDMIKEKAGNVKARLGGINSRLHSVKKPVSLKASPPSAKLKILPKMKADLTRRDIPIHKRLGGNNNSNKSKPSSVSTISKRLGQVNIENKSSTITTARGAKSVFDRLGYSS